MTLSPQTQTHLSYAVEKANQELWNESIIIFCYAANPKKEQFKNLAHRVGLRAILIFGAHKKEIRKLYLSLQ